MSRPQVKICGLTTPEDALLAVELGADHLGLNFYPPSPRAVDLETAQRIRAAVGPSVSLVGVFVDHPRSEIERLDAAVGLDLIQLHGDESPADAEGWIERVLKVFRVGSGFDSAALEPWSECWGFLFDRFDPNLHGGTGEAWDYHLVSGLETQKPVFVAGGLAPGQLALHCGRLAVTGYDVCSGVESSPGRKDPELMRRFLEEVHDGQTTTTA